MSEIRSVASFRGKFKQGKIADLLIKITDFDGTPINPSVIECTIEGPVESPSISGDLIIDASNPFQITDGYYVYSWDVNSEQSIGNYNVTWAYVVN